MNNPNWVVDFLKSLDEVQLKELLITVALITDPLSQELMKKASATCENCEVLSQLETKKWTIAYKESEVEG